MRMGKWEWGDARAESSGSWISSLGAPVLELDVNVKSLSNCPPNYKRIHFLFEVPYLCSSSSVALWDRDLFLLPVSGRKSVCSSLGI